LLVVGTVAGLAALAFGLVWIQTGPREAGATAGATGGSAKAKAPAVAVAPSATASAPAPRSLAAAGVRPAATPAASSAPGEPVRHVDLYFDVNKARLRADAVTVLQEQTAAVAAGGSWAVLVQGYADQVGAAEYNRALAQRRAEAVKQFLVELGVPATSIKVVTIGQEGALCDDPGAECRKLNRRVHVELRRLHAGAAGPAALATAPALAAGPALTAAEGLAAPPAGALRPGLAAATTVRDEQLFEVR
jgi:peptidoglycan-associated lipoprotein